MARKKKRAGLRKPKFKPVSSDMVVLSPSEVSRITAIEAPELGDQPPVVNRDNLLECHRYLAAHLSFPFEAGYQLESDPVNEPDHPVVVVGLVDPDQRLMDEGIICEVIEDGETIEIPLSAVDLELDSKNSELIDGYLGWFCEAEEEEEEDSELASVDGVRFNVAGAPLDFRNVFWVSLFCCVVGGLFGFILGTILGAVEIARISAVFGALLLGSLGVIATIQNGALARASKTVRRLDLGARLYLVLFGAAAGAVVGAMLVAFVGILIGAVVGCLFGALVRRGPITAVTGLLFGAVVGPVVLALYLDRERALTWGMHGAWIGAAAGLLYALTSFMRTPVEADAANRT